MTEEELEEWLERNTLQGIVRNELIMGNNIIYKEGGVHGQVRQDHGRLGDTAGDTGGGGGAGAADQRSD